MPQQPMIPHLGEFTAKMAKAGLTPLVLDTFAHYYRKLVGGATGLIHDVDILPIAPADVPRAEALERYAGAGRRVLNQTVRIVLNGGLGTSMGLTGPKSLLKVKQGRSFLEILLRQAELSNSRLALMNSFNTHTATLAAIAELTPSRPPLCFLQHRFPKILQGELAPVSWPANRELEWNPPGHGDVYAALHASGMLQKLLDEGVRHALICNSDNLGAGIDEALLGYFAENRLPFMMEVAEKTPADEKGGHLARLRNGRLILRESAQCPPEDMAAFQDIRRYRYFNTNNIWLNLEYLKALIVKHRIIDLPMIVNPKTVDPRDAKSPPVYQIETAMGSAISLFEGAVAVNVPRARFLPVKTCNDLLAVRSDCFVYSEREGLRINPARASAGLNEPVKIRLDAKYYGKFDQLEARFPEGAPSLVECDALTIHGDVRFEGDVTIRGAVTLTNPGSTPALVKRKTVIERDVNFSPTLQSHPAATASQPRYPR